MLMVDENVNLDAIMANFGGADDDDHHEFIVRGQCLPLESKRSCELAVECWNLRNSLLEADLSFNATKKDLKMQKYTVKRIESVMTTLQKALQEKDKVLKDKSIEIETLKRKIEDVVASRRGIIANFARSETDTKNVATKISRLEIENLTLKSQISEQERRWNEKFNSMEYILTMDAKQAEKERDDLDLALQDCTRRVALAELTTQQTVRSIGESGKRVALLEAVNEDLTAKCVWGLELEQAYESLHAKVELMTAERDRAVRRAANLEREKSRIHSFVLSEGIQLPHFTGADDGDES